MNWETTYIIGAGVSAGPVDVSRLTGGVVLGVNDAAFHKPVDAFFSLDHNYILRVLPKLAAFKGEKHFCLMDRVYYKDVYKQVGAKRWHRDYTELPILDYDKPRLSSGGPQDGCSGLVAINLAARMGAKRIFLFGYDFHHTYRYFYSNEVMKRSHAGEVLKRFRKVAPWYKARNIEVINCNLDSYIDAFELISIEMAYETIDRLCGVVGCGA